MRTILLAATFFASCLIQGTRLKAQNDTRKFSILITNEKKQALPNAEVDLIDDFGKVLKGKTNSEGIVTFDIGTIENYSKARAVVTKGANKFDTPIFVNYRLKMLTIEMPDDMVIITDGWDDAKINDLKEPTVNKKVSTDKNIYAKANFSYSPEFGPYTSDCNSNPLASVPTYDNHAIESEKTLLDAISSSCIDAAGDAVNSLVDLTYATVAIKNKLTAVYDDQLSKGKTTSGEAELQKMVSEDGPKIKTAFADAIEKTKTLYEGMEKLIAGPELYVVTCIWDGIKKYYVPDDIMKVKKATESFGKAKEGMYSKLTALKNRAENYDGLTLKDKDLLTNWSDVTENVEKTIAGLSILVGYASNPRKSFTSFESQAANALRSAESLIGNVTEDCKIIDLDKAVKTGIETGQTALAAKRKFMAQMSKEESKWKDRINAIAGTKPWYPFGQEDIAWPANAMAPLIGIESQWVQLVPYHNERVNAQKDVERIVQLLSKLSDVCRRTQSASVIVNQKIEKYEQLYISGCQAADKCEISNAYIILSQLRELERTACGHFYPHPFGFIKSDNLNSRIERNKERCKTGTGEAPVDPSWLSTVLYKIQAACTNTSDPRNTIEDVRVTMTFDGKRVLATGGSTMFPAGPHNLNITIEPKEEASSGNSSYLIKRVEWMRCAAGVYKEERPLASETPNSSEVTMKVNIVKNDDKNHCYKAVIYVDKCRK